MYKKSEIPGNGLKNFQNVFKMLPMLVLLSKNKAKFLNFSFRSKSFVKHFQWANKTFLVRHNFGAL